ncbi:IclR family transcriptional regulator [Volucribacter amazonae]|uniref:Transcriptional regulator n=1 Tax=Volucribacter amazonae TaxID=256731 RepID=A0A9X4PNI0_9PAST|nr:IclR family transcriptional regulator [Volucribacter amazonae]MDG6895013.1 transcriptional regulator [Volucribacter amazonae]
MEKNQGNQSLIRGLRLIDLLSNYPNGCPLAHLTKLVGLNKSTVHRLLQGLQSEGFVCPANSTGSYRLTTKCLSIGHKTLASLNIINVAMPYLEQLNLTLGETVNFSKREDDHALMIYKLEPTTGMMKTRAYIGQHLPLYCSAMGKLYLAFEDDPAYLTTYWQSHQEIIQQLTAKTITSLDKMCEELNKIQLEHYAMDREENELGVMCIAYPIFNHQHKVEYAVSVSASIYKFAQLGMANVQQQIQLTAQGISQELGANIE